MNTYYLIVVLAQSMNTAGVSNDLLEFKTSEACNLVRTEYLKVKGESTYERRSYISTCFTYSSS